VTRETEPGGTLPDDESYALPALVVSAIGGPPRAMQRAAFGRSVSRVTTTWRLGAEIQEALPHVQFHHHPIASCCG
jgi:hypothetical protein